MLPRSIIVILISFTSISYGQNHTVKVFSDTRFEFKHPWAGGMNSCQFGKIDMDLDGIKDLVVFDRVGDRILPFLVINSGGNYDYRYAPEFAGNFPVLSHWAVFTDYDLDGKEDIFTYSPGYAGMKVFKNTSVDELEFRLEVFPHLKSFQGGGYVNILVTYADYPAIKDLDGDGDLDILTFYGLGSFVEKHRNLSMEKYGHADSLDYIKTESCWGYFAESEENNAIVLDTCLRCGEAGMRGSGEAGRHTGSTFCVLDMNANQLPDLLLGDVNYPNLIALYNGGNPDTARMTSYDWQYPAGEQAIDLFSMPAAFYEDFDFDGVKDLLVAPFDPNPFLPENFRSNWLYHNSGREDQPQFSLQTRSFLQKDMLDFGAGSYPVVFDFDQDGLLDLLVGNFGYYDTSYYDQNLILHTDHSGQIARLKNSGTASQPSFTLIDRDLAGVSASELNGVMPAFEDLDGDGDPDMLLGTAEGWIRYYENTAGQGNPAVFELTEEYYQGIDPGAFSAPQLFDLDSDDLPDLIIGEKGGNLNFYRNYGSMQNPSFILVDDSLGKINVTDYSISLDGFSVPHFYRDAAQRTHLLVGSEQGKVFYYTGIDGNIYGTYASSDTLAGLIGLQEVQTDFGYRSSPALADLDSDGWPELIAGNFSGGLNFYGKNLQTPVNQISDTHIINNRILSIYPNPAHNEINIAFIDSGEFDYSAISIYNHLGQQVANLSGNSARTMIIDSRYLARGIYFIKVSFSNSYSSKLFHYSGKIILD